MAQPTAPAVPTGLPLRPLVTRSDSLTSTNSAHSGASLKRRSRTRTRTLTNAGRRGKSAGPADVSKVCRRSCLAFVRRADTFSPLYNREGLQSMPWSQNLKHHPCRRDCHAGRAQLRRIPQKGLKRNGRGNPRRARELGVPCRIATAVGTPVVGDKPSLRVVLRKRYVQQIVHSMQDLTLHPKAKMRARGVSLPRSAFRHMSSSDESSEAGPQTPVTFSVDPSVRVVSRDNRHIRDSITSNSSSLYPASTSSESYPESSIHPHSLKDKDDDVSSFSPRVVTHHASLPEFNVDDVSYRLRLLVNNSYFLPPAHSKPTPLSLAPPNPPPASQRQTKQTTPSFLDFFRVGKSKSKPTSPSAPNPAIPDPLPGPVLRTTSDSTTASGYLPRAATAHQPAIPPSFSTQPSSGSRVVVLRESLTDLKEAAKQAEREIKLRGEGRKAKSQATPRVDDLVDDVIDPTDVVDLPPPSSTYPFAVQASALHGLGPQESLGAAVLADFLPPSPGMWSMSTEEDTWRKAILHEAVSLSLSESPETSFSSMSPTSPKPDAQSACFRDPSIDKSEESGSPQTPKAMIGQRILEPSIIERDASAGPALSPLQGLQTLPTSPVSLSSVLATSDSADAPWRHSANPPRRAETPAATMPLTPPPRKPVQSSESSAPPVLAAEAEQIQEVKPPTIVYEEVPVAETPEAPKGEEQRSSTVSTDVSLPERALTLSPPLMNHSGDMPSFAEQLSQARASPYSEDDDLSYATPLEGDMDDDVAPRESFTLSVSSNRPSMSEYSNPSPTASAFQDAVFGSYRTPSPLLLRRSPIDSVSPMVSPVSLTHDPVSSPPPRTSSSLGQGTLPPPPRSPAIRPLFRPSTSGSSDSSRSILRHGHGQESDLSHILSRQPNPRISLAERRGNSPSLSLHIPTDPIPPTIHTAPAPASPTAFFDRIQSHPNAMDDLDTSDDSDDSDDLSLEAVSDNEDEEVETAAVFIEPRTQAVSNRPSSSSSRPSIMRLGNHSTPQLSPSPSWTGEPFPPYDSDRRKPISNVVPQAGGSSAGFASRTNKKSGKGISSAQLPPSLHPFPRSHSRESLAKGSASETGSSPTRSSRSRSRSVPRPPQSRRPNTATGAGEGGDSRQARAIQRESIQRFDGMLLEHIASEREAIKRITSNLSNAR